MSWAGRRAVMEEAGWACALSRSSGASSSSCPQKASSQSRGRSSSNSLLGSLQGATEERNGMVGIMGVPPARTPLHSRLLPCHPVTGSD